MLSSVNAYDFAENNSSLDFLSLISSYKERENRKIHIQYHCQYPVGILIHINTSPKIDATESLIS